jgi:hypothetical protein
MNQTQERIDLAIARLWSGAPIALTQAVDAVLADGPLDGLRRDEVRLLVALRFHGEPLLAGIARALQIACERTREASLPLPDREQLLGVLAQAHPGATEDEAEEALDAFAEHQRAQGARFAARAGMLRLELIRRRAAR